MLIRKINENWFIAYDALGRQYTCKVVPPQVRACRNFRWFPIDHIKGLGLRF